MMSGEDSNALVNDRLYPLGSEKDVSSLRLHGYPCRYLRTPLTKLMKPTTKWTFQQ